MTRARLLAFACCLLMPMVAHAQSVNIDLGAAGEAGLFNALVLDWVSPKCHTLMKPPSGSGVGDSCDALPCDSFAGNLHSRMGLPWHRSVHLLTC